MKIVNDIAYTDKGKYYGHCCSKCHKPIYYFYKGRKIIYQTKPTKKIICTLCATKVYNMEDKDTILTTDKPEELETPRKVMEEEHPLQEKEETNKVIKEGIQGPYYRYDNGNKKREYYIIDGKTKLTSHINVELKIGRFLRQDEVVHHIDGNCENDDINNLQLMLIQEHFEFHHTHKFKEKLTEREVKQIEFEKITNDIANYLKSLGF